MDTPADKVIARVRELEAALGRWVREPAAKKADDTPTATAFDTSTRIAPPSLPPVVRFDVRMRPDVKVRPGAAAWRKEGGAAEAVAVTARPLEGMSYELLGPDGQAVLVLPAELAERYHGDAAMNKVRLSLRIVEETDDVVRLVVDVLPGPTKEKMNLTLDFGGERRDFEVAAHAGAPRQLTSAPCEPLPRAALGLGPAADGTALRQVAAAVEMRRIFAA